MTTTRTIIIDIDTPLGNKLWQLLAEMMETFPNIIVIEEQDLLD